MSNDNIVFQPIRCQENYVTQKKERHENLNGGLIFTTDTRKIYLGTENDVVPMNGNIEIYYGNKPIEQDNSGHKPDANVTFYFPGEINGKYIPQKEDLILNVDGCFYKVKDVDENEIHTERLTLQGTGSSIPGGGGGTSGSYLALTWGNGQMSYYFEEEEKEALIYYLPTDTLDSENWIVTVNCSFDESFTDIFHTEENLTNKCGIIHSINIAPYLSKLKNSQKIYLQVIDKYGVNRSIRYNINKVILQINSSQPSLFSAYNDFNYTCEISGSNFDSKKIYYTFKDDSGIILEDLSYSKSIPNTQFTISELIQTDKFNHGIYNLEVYVVGKIGTKEIHSNKTLKYRVSVFKEDIGLPILSVKLPEKMEQYDDLDILYLLTTTTDNNQTYESIIYIDNEEKARKNITPNAIEKYRFNSDFSGDYFLNIAISSLGLEYSSAFTVTPYSSDLPYIDINNTNLMFYLNPKDKTNNSKTNMLWENYKKSSNFAPAELKDFHFGNVNGWFQEENGDKYLKVSQGASVSLKSFSPFDKNATLDGLTIELDFKTYGVTNLETSFIECLSKNNNGDIVTGFKITGDNFKYYIGNNAIMDMNFIQGDRIKMAFAIEPSSSSVGETDKKSLCYVYINGILTYVEAYDSNVELKNGHNKGFLEIKSEGGYINIYGIRFYDKYLKPKDILNNYQASLSKQDREYSFNQNNILKIVPTGEKNPDGSNITKDIIDLNAIESQAYDLRIPYVKIIGGYPSSKDFKMEEYSENISAALPTGKKDYRAIDIEIVYPKPVYNEKGVAIKNKFFEGFEDQKIITTFEDSNATVLNGFGKTAKTGAIMYAQGTSSLEYPVKNLRVKFAGGKKIKVLPKYPAVDLVCFKADFMESSGSHNTGAANFIDTLYEGIGLSTPGQDKYSTTTEKIVTSIKGHPCVIFWSPTGEENSFEYIGKYNLNLDKATPEPFGFICDEKDNFGYLKDENNTLVLDKDGNKQNAIYCFEFLDNTVEVCNFKSHPSADGASESEKYYNSWYNQFDNGKGTMVPGWRLGFESRYPEDKEGTNDADALYPFASWVNELYNLYTQELAEGKNPGIEYIYRYDEANSYDATKQYYKKDGDNYYEAYPNEDDFGKGTIYYTRVLLKTQYGMNSLLRFRNEYQKYLDKDFLIAYYVISEALLMIDSRVKNMMIATWGKEHRDFVKNDGTTEHVYDYIWYPIFYDMDTMLGLDNEGKRDKKKWYNEDTDEGVYNGGCVLWDFVRDALPDEIEAFYHRAENANKLTLDGILPHFSDNQANMANEVFYNEDGFYKYITNFKNGYYDTEKQEFVAPGKAQFLYALQGNRSVLRKWFLNNRIKFLRGKYNTEDYQNEDRIEFRLTYPKTGTDPRTDESIKYVEPKGIFEFTSINKGFSGVKLGQNGVPVSKRFEPNQRQKIQINTTDGNRTETYLLGVSNLADVGDLSDKYLYKFIDDNVGENNLKRLIVGNHHEKYYNPNLTNEIISLNSYTFLEEVNFENCGAFTGSISCSNNLNLKTVNLLGSLCSSLNLPVGGIIEELRLPPSIQNLNIESQSKLTYDNFTLGRFNYVSNSFENDYSKLQNISLKDTLKEDSYKILKNTVLAANDDGSGLGLNGYCFQGINWEITDSSDIIIENGKMTGIKVLDRLGAAPKDSPFYDKVKPWGVPTSEALTGKITINVNTGSNYIIDEFDLYMKYHKIYPNLEFEYKSGNVQKAFVIKFYNTEEALGDPYYTVLTNGTLTLEELISEKMPNGPLTTPQKSSSNDQIFEFDGSWKVIKSESGNNFNINEIILQSNFKNYTPKANASFAARFNSTSKLYKVTLYDEDGKTILVSTNLNWGDNIGEKLEKTFSKSYYNYKPYNDDNYRKEFKGWQSQTEYDQKANTYFDLTDKQINGEFKAYAYYELEDARTTPSNSKYFDFSNDTISLKPKYKGVLGGKITLPNTGNNKTLTVVGDFKDTNNLITHVFFLDNCNYNEIARDAFSDSGTVKYGKGLEAIYLPLTINKIGANAFYGIIDLKTIGSKEDNYNNISTIGTNAFFGCSSLIIKELPDNLETLEDYAFRGCSKIVVTKLPNSLAYSSRAFHVFSNCPYVRISEFGTENSGQALNYIPKYFLASSGKGTTTPEINQIRIGSGITQVGQNCFEDSYATSISNIVFDNWSNIKNENGEVFNNQEDLLSYMGIGTSTSTVSIMSLEEEKIIL